MSKQSGSNIVHQYFKKEDENGKTLIKVNPIHLTGVEIIVPVKGEAESNEVELTGEFETELKKEGFQACSPLEFNLHWSGLI
jgi:hypothetical protein